MRYQIEILLCAMRLHEMNVTWLFESKRNNIFNHTSEYTRLQRISLLLSDIKTSRYSFRYTKCRKYSFRTCKASAFSLANWTQKLHEHFQMDMFYKFNNKLRVTLPLFFDDHFHILNYLRHKKVNNFEVLKFLN